MGGKHLAQLGAIVMAALAGTAALMDGTRTASAPADASSPASLSVAAPDPLAPELRHCVALGEAGANDAACLATWAENRRRFLAPKNALQSSEEAH